MINMSKVQSWSRWKVVLALLITISLAFATGAMVNAMVEAHRSNAAFALFSHRIQSADYQRAYDLTSREFRAATSQDQFAEQQRALSSSIGKLEKITTLSFDTEHERDGWTSAISATFSYEHAERNFDIQMKKEDNDWKVYGYKED